MPKYAVACGKIPGVYDTWEECQQQVHGFPRPVFKKFNTQEEAENFIRERSSQEPRVNSFKPLPQITVPRELPQQNDATIQLLLSRINALEDTMNKFMGDISNRLNTLSTRLMTIEGKRNASSTDIDDGEEPRATKKPKDDYQFMKDEDGHVEVYTDGACSNNGRTGARAGIGVWFGDGHPLNLSLPVKGAPTNNNAEIQAARLAINQAASAGVSKLTVYTDSAFLITCITQWIHKWKKNDWKLSSGGNVKNKDELVKLDESLQRVAVVRWVHVKGHRGIRGNEMADKLARDGAERYDPSVTYSNLL